MVFKEECLYSQPFRLHSYAKLKRYTTKKDKKTPKQTRRELQVHCK